MENTYHLVVDRRARGRHPGTPGEFASAGLVIVDAADGEAGEFPRRSRRMETQP
jgi:hypothetical protein